MLYFILFPSSDLGVDDSDTVKTGVCEPLGVRSGGTQPILAVGSVHPDSWGPHY